MTFSYEALSGLCMAFTSNLGGLGESGGDRDVAINSSLFYEVPMRILCSFYKL